MREYVSSASLDRPRDVYIRASRCMIFEFFGSSSSAALASSSAATKLLADIYAAARLLKYVDDAGSASIAFKQISA